jgi:hypothetical protein
MSNAVCRVNQRVMRLKLNKIHRNWPNIAVKGTRRPSAVVSLGGFFGFAGFVNLCQPARALLLR